MDLAEGDQVILMKSFPMNNFTSKTLNRTFKEILFVFQKILMLVENLLVGLVELFELVDFVDQFLAGEEGRLFFIFEL